MKRASTNSGGGFPEEGGQGWEARRERPNGGWKGKTPAPEAKWSHEEAMKKRPRVGGEASFVGDGGGWPREVEAEKAGLHGRSCGGDEVEKEMYDWRWTEGLSPEMLALILRGRFPADEIARGPAAVCRAWREGVASPDVWGDVDIEAWCRRVNCRVKADAAVRRIVARAQGTLRRLSAYRVGNLALAYLASSGKLLNVLHIPMSEITDHYVEKYVEYFPALRVLDISNCLRITSRGIEAIGRHCKSLVELKRNMPPLGNNASPIVFEDEALAIANTMPMLKQLVLAYGLFSDIGLDAILTKCPLLCSLDILGSLNVKLDCDIEDRCCALESFREPWEPEYHEYSSSGSGSDFDYDDTESDD